MSLVGAVALVAGVAALAVVVMGPVRGAIDSARRERARPLEGTARLHAIGAEEQRVEAIRSEREATSDAEAEAAAEAREAAERELESASREGKTARILDPDVDSEPDPLV